MSPITYQGTGSRVTLDSAAGTLTFEHSGMLTHKSKREASPWVVSVDSVDKIEWREASFKPAEFRVITTDGTGYNTTKNLDLNYVMGSAKIGDFVAAVESCRDGHGPATAVRSSAPTTQGATHSVTPPTKQRSFLEALADQAVQAEFEGIKLKGSSIHFKMSKFPAAGATAVVEVGGTQRRTTATRVVLGSVVTFGVGTAIGAMAKKKSNNIYLTVELADGQVIIVEAKSKLEGKARKFAAAINQAGAVQRAKQQRAIETPSTAKFVESVREDVIEPAPVASPVPPPPPSVPAGWYSDPSGSPIQRYWDGSGWTEHTAPLLPPV